MKRIYRIYVGVLLCGFLVATNVLDLAAQGPITFPAPVRLEFNPSPDHATLVNYEISLVGTPATAPLVIVVPLTACPNAAITTLCSFPFTIANMGPWTVNFVAVGNAVTWNGLRSTSASVVFSARNPSPARIIRVVLGS